MKQCELDKIDKINQRKLVNFDVIKLVAHYLNNAPRFMTSEMMNDITKGHKEDENRVYARFLANLFTEDEEYSRQLQEEYFSKGLKELSVREYSNNPYYQNIKIPVTKEGQWNLGYQEYMPYEAFIYRDIQLLPDYVEIPQIGYFKESFSFPTVFENGVEWMAIKPNEIETMKRPIERASGRVLVYGLGLGYFAYMVSEKSDVSSVTIIERDENVIKLFEKHILPQFPNKDKIKIIKSDAFDYAKNVMPVGTPSYVFVDLWHDVSDGLDLYIKMKKYEPLCPNTVFDYWIEDSILSSIRWSIFDGLLYNVQNGSFKGTLIELENYLTNKYLKNFVKYI